MITYQELYEKTQRLARTSNTDVLTQLKEDINTGYQMFNAKLSRYFTRKQQFTDLVSGQQIYQTPIDCIRIMGMTVTVTTNYQPTVKEIRSEYEWRNITSYPMESNWPTYYYMIGNDSFGLWPIPSQDVVNGLRFYYQPQDHDLTQNDTTSTSTGFTVTVTNGSTTVTANGAAFTEDMVSLWFQVTGVTDTTWYEIVGATTTTLTLKSAYVASSGAGLNWRVGQLMIIPQEYSDAPMHYSLSNFFSAQGNEQRSDFHMKRYEEMVKDCKQEYSSSNQSQVITGNEVAAINIWAAPPPAG